MDVETSDLLRESIRGLLKCDETDLVAELDQLGWQDAVADDPAAAVDLLFTEQGRAGRGSACLDNVLVDAAAGDLYEAGGAERSLAVIHPIGAATSAASDGRLLIDGVTLSDPATTRGCVVAADGDASTVYFVHPERLTNAATRVRGIDPNSSLHRVRIDVSLGDAEERECDWGGAVAAARRALAAELVGNGSAMLDIAVAHVSQRTQFGRPIAANQTPRHRLAECQVRLAGARGLIDAAWKSGTSWDASVAKAYAGSASDTVGRTCLQVCGAIGLTSEHTLGGYVARARILDALYGGWRTCVQDIGLALLHRESIPAGPPI